MKSDTNSFIIALDTYFYDIVPAVITLCSTESNLTHDGIPLPEACRRLEEAGADVVGLNCSRGPVTMLSAIKEVKKACKVTIIPLHSDVKKEKCV